MKMARLPRKKWTSDHLQSCPECREDLQLLSKFHVAGSLPLQEPPQIWVERAVALARGSELKKKLVQKLADLVFDSWALSEPVGVRGDSTTEHRRLRFEIDHLTLDLRAESQKSNWSFVAQVSGLDPQHVQLQADSMTMIPDDFGICQWSQTKPPKTLFVKTDTITVQIPDLKWSKKQSKK